MKRYSAACLIAVTAGTAHAQSSVTLYGLIDVGVTYTNNAQTGKANGHNIGASQVALTDAHTTGLSGSRWGLRGTEDLGDGLKAIFVLENGFMVNSGALAQGGAEFGRQAYVGLVSANYGTVTAGRQYDPLVESVQQFSASGYWGGYMSSHLNDIDNLSNTNRINNSIKYTTPTFHGIRAGGLYSFGGVAGSNTQNQIWSLGINYNGGSFSLGAGYLNARDPNVSFYGNTPNKGLATANNIGSFGSTTAPEASPGSAGYASAKTLEIIGGGAAYKISQTTITAVVTNTRFGSLGSSSGPNPLHYSGNAIFTSAELGVRTMITPALLTGIAFDYTQRNSVNGDGGAKYLQLDLGADYNLSKRTDVYALAVLQKANGRDSLGQSAVADISGFTPSSTDKQIGLRLGLRHKF
ncbi:porin [Paraburkholderia lacunae]|uniref:Porin n=1 Tax=Paraburkholderia lacunae TaxID=2211104 RepID=A0A370N1X0_9BURK|nr:porin [Paraburkholderia lacunae]RDJ99618.1 porin [Paraburkholderia lacunae]